MLYWKPSKQLMKTHNSTFECKTRMESTPRPIEKNLFSLTTTSLARPEKRKACYSVIYNTCVNDTSNLFISLSSIVLSFCWTGLFILFGFFFIRQNPEARVTYEDSIAKIFCCIFLCVLI